VVELGVTGPCAAVGDQLFVPAVRGSIVPTVRGPVVAVVAADTTGYRRCAYRSCRQQELPPCLVELFA